MTVGRLTTDELAPECLPGNNECDDMNTKPMADESRSVRTTRKVLAWTALLAVSWGIVSCTSVRQRPGSKPLELNHGQKWSVPSTMMVYLRNIEQDVQAFESPSEAAHAALARKIQDNLSGLVTHCTMQGKAHDELHKWLIPFLALSDEYARATDAQMQAAKQQEIKQALVVFQSYFE